MGCYEQKSETKIDFKSLDCSHDNYIPKSVLQISNLLNNRFGPSQLIYIPSHDGQIYLNRFQSDLKVSCEQGDLEFIFTLWG